MHETIIFWIIVGMGILAGTINYLYYYFKTPDTKKFEFLKFVLLSIGAASLVPLLLNMLSSDLIKTTVDSKGKVQYDTIKYFVFAGFCFVAGYFSDRFIDSIGDKILKDLENTKAKAKDAEAEAKKANAKAEDAVTKAKNNEEQVKLLIDVDSESEEPIEESISKLAISANDKNETLDALSKGVLKSLQGKFKFRTAMGITKELNSRENLIQSILESLERFGLVKRITIQNDKTGWFITGIGKDFSK